MSNSSIEDDEEEDEDELDEEEDDDAELVESDSGGGGGMPPPMPAGPDALADCRPKVCWKTLFNSLACEEVSEPDDSRLEIRLSIFDDRLPDEDEDELDDAALCSELSIEVRAEDSALSSDDEMLPLVTSLERVD